jgi:RNA polymerase sigma factor (sigma-70 family)
VPRPRADLPLSDAQRDLAGAHIGLVGRMVALHLRRRPDLRRHADELFSLGMDLLMMAARNYSPSYRSAKTGRPVKFSTFACQYVGRGLGNLGRCGVVYVPRYREKEGRPAPHTHCVGLPGEEDALGVLLLLGAGVLAHAKPGPDDERHAARLAALPDALEALPRREREVLRRRFGLAGGAETLEEVGRLIGLTKERVRQVEAQALGKLGAALAAGE